VSSFSAYGAADVTFRKDGIRAANRDGTFDRLSTQRVAILECSGCNDRIVVIEDQLVGGVLGGNSGTISWKGFHWWPIPGANTFGSEVPPAVGSAYGEGMRCLSAGAPNGAVAMFRTATYWIVDDKGSVAAKGKYSLKDKVKQMVADGDLLPTIGDWVDEVRISGNAAVHPDVYGPVTVVDASEVARLTESLIDYLYMQPARLAAKKAKRTP
jgi:hypothetical protein